MDWLHCTWQIAVCQDTSRGWEHLSLDCEVSHPLGFFHICFCSFFHPTWQVFLSFYRRIFIILQSWFLMVMIYVVLMYYHCFLHRKRWSKFLPNFPGTPVKADDSLCSFFWFVCGLVGFFSFTRRCVLFYWSCVGCWGARQWGGPSPRPQWNLLPVFWTQLICHPRKVFTASVGFLQQLWQSSEM